MRKIYSVGRNLNILLAIQKESPSQAEFLASQKSEPTECAEIGTLQVNRNLRKLKQNFSFLNICALQRRMKNINPKVAQGHTVSDWVCVPNERSILLEKLNQARRFAQIK